MTPTKRCTGPCGRTLPLDAFHRDRTKRDGHMSQCGECRSAATRARRAERGAERRERERASRAADPTFQSSVRRSATALADLTPDDPERPARERELAAKADAVLARKLGAASGSDRQQH